MEKPQILSDKQFKEWCLRQECDLRDGCAEKYGVFCEAQAQLDADIAWCESQRKEWMESDRSWLANVKGWRNPEQINELIQQARQEVAREMIGDLDRVLPEMGMYPYLYEEFKSKWGQK